MKALWNRLSVGGRLCLAVIAAYFLCAAWGGVRSLRARLADETPAYNVVDVNARYQPPSAAHWMGTDNLGRDVSARLVQGAWISFQVGIGTSLIAIPLGVLLGLLGGYFGGKTDSLVVWLCATVASMPGLLFILAISLIAGKGILGIGVQGEPSWGVMINNARLRLWQGVWWEMTFVTMAIFALVLVFNHLADELRDILDPALRNERN